MISVSIAALLAFLDADVLIVWPIVQRFKLLPHRTWCRLALGSLGEKHGNSKGMATPPPCVPDAAARLRKSGSSK
jgi:hypothetical protein